MLDEPFDKEALAAGIRDVTDEEVAFYEEHGWVKMDGLVDPGIVETMRVRADEIYHREGPDGLVSIGIRKHVEPFRSFVLSEGMGRMAHRLINRRRLTGTDVPTRIRGGQVIRREPDAYTGGWHQDSSEHGSDRVGEFNGWLALDEVTPDMGAMRFLTGVHREGPLGAGFEDTLRTYPKLLELYEWSPPFHYQPGDMTVHHGYMIHGSPPNSTNKIRWSYLISYAPADTKYINGEIKNNGTLRTTPDEAKHPVVYPV